MRKAARVSTRSNMQADTITTLGFRAKKKIATASKVDSENGGGTSAGSKRSAPSSTGMPSKVSRNFKTHSKPHVDTEKKGPDNGRLAPAPTSQAPRAMTRSEWRVTDAIEHLKGAGLETLIKKHGMPKFYDEEDCDQPSHFQSLAKAIVFQQLAGAAAKTIWRRFCVHVSEDQDFTGFFHPDVTCVRVAALDDKKALELCGIGLSKQKASYIRDLAAKFKEPQFQRLEALPDAQLRETLLSVKGVGPWTVDMFMLFTLHRSDILPVGDLGVRKGMQACFKLKALPTPKQMEELASPWAPFRSVGSWYMWQLANTIVPGAKG